MFAASGANVDELDYGNEVVDFDGGGGCIWHGSVLVGFFECSKTLTNIL